MKSLIREFCNLVRFILFFFNFTFLFVLGTHSYNNFAFSQSVKIGLSLYNPKEVYKVSLFGLLWL